MKKSNLVAVFMGTIGTLCMGIGMSLCMRFDNIPVGIVIGIVGILLLLLLIPLVKSED